MLCIEWGLSHGAGLLSLGANFPHLCNLKRNPPGRGDAIRSSATPTRVVKTGTALLHCCAFGGPGSSVPSSAGMILCARGVRGTIGRTILKHLRAARRYKYWF